MKICLHLTILLFLLCRHTSADTFHVSTTGDDVSGDGSSANPWKTLKHAVTQVPANQGHTIELGTGTFIESGQIEIPPGVNVAGAGKNLTILKASSLFYYNPPSPGYATDKFLISLTATSPVDGDQTLQNFTVEGDSKQLHGAIYVRYRDRVIIDAVTVRDTNFTGIWLWDVKDSKITDTDLINCSWGSTGYCSGALNLGNLERVEIDHLNVNESVGYGIKAIGPDDYNSIVGLKIHDSRISVNPFGLWNDGKAPNIAIELWHVNLVGCEIYNCYIDNTISLVNSNSPPATGIQAIRVHHNTIDIETRAKGAGYGMELSINDAEVDHNYFLKGRYGIAHWDNPVQNWNIHHNVFYGLEGFYPGDVLRSQRSGLQNVNFHNNTIEFTGNSTINVVGLYGGTSENVNVINNLIINDNTGYNYYPNSFIRLENGAVVNNLTVKNNLLDRLPIGNVEGIYSDNLTGNPKISESGDRPEPYYSPASGSRLIDAGLDLSLPFLGLAPDIGAYEYTTTPDNLPPEVVIISPTSNSSFRPGSTVTITVNASDNDGTVSKVEFFHGTTKIGEDFNSPYNHDWQAITPGSYSLTAKATDNNGGTTTSTAIPVTIMPPNEIPSVIISSPENNATFTHGSSVNITATASDNDGTITKVEFFNGTTKLGEDLTSPYSYNWANVAAGTYSLTARARDNEGATSISAEVQARIVIKVGLYAPDAELAGDMKLTSDSTAAKGSYFSIPPGHGTNHDIPPSSSAQFNFELPKTDLYVAWVRLKSPGTDNRGYHVYDGKGNWTSWLADVYTEWTWVQITNAYTNETATFPFTAGPNIFRMAWFHENVPVDQVIITNDFNFQPSDREGSVEGRTRAYPSTSRTMEEAEPDLGAQMFPNPVKDDLKITITSNTEQKAEIAINGVTSFRPGKRMLIQLHRGVNVVDVSMVDTESGLYIVSVSTSDGKTYRGKILVTR